MGTWNCSTRKKALANCGKLFKKYIYINMHTLRILYILIWKSFKCYARRWVWILSSKEIDVVRFLIKQVFSRIRRLHICFEIPLTWQRPFYPVLEWGVMCISCKDSLHFYIYNIDNISKSFVFFFFDKNK